MRLRAVVGGVAAICIISSGLAGAASQTRRAQQHRFAVGVRKLVNTITSRKVAVHVANSSSRATLTAGSVGLNHLGVGLGVTDAVIAAAGLTRQLREKPLREVLRDPVTETLGSIGFTGLGNALRMAGLPELAEVSFTGALMLGGHGLKSALSVASDPPPGAAERHVGNSRRKLRALARATRTLRTMAGNVGRVLRDQRTGLAGANAFMKMSLMALTANRPVISATLASVGVTLGVIPIAAQIHGRTASEIGRSLVAIARNPMAITTGAIALTDLGVGAGEVHQHAASTVAFGSALLTSVVSATRALRDGAGPSAADEITAQSLESE
jgi:hypothetical protein